MASSASSQSLPNAKSQSSINPVQDVRPPLEATASSNRLVCAFDVCKAMENLKLCKSCKGTWYCCKEHQVSHWKVHKKSCKKGTQQKQERTRPTLPITKGGTDVKQESVSRPDQENLEDSLILHGRLNNIATAKTTIDTEAESASNVHADIAQFSDNITRKHSYTLTPYQENNAGNSDFKSSTEPEKFVSVRSDTQQENMPPGNLHVTTGQSGGRNALVGYVSEHMQKFGICVVDKFLEQEQGDSIWSEVKRMWDSHGFRHGQLVTDRNIGSTKNIRGDMITWTDGTDQETKNIGFLISKIDSIVQKCRDHLEGFKNISCRTEAMVACYPGNGTHYVKHVDNPNEDGRCITCIYYLNKGWDSEKMGGSLRLYPQAHNMVTVDPVFNRLIFFWSDRRNPHEVLPTHNTRYAITVWYFDALERRKALTSATV